MAALDATLARLTLSADEDDVLVDVAPDVLLPSIDVVVAARILDTWPIRVDLIEKVFRNVWPEVNFSIRSASTAHTANIFLFQFDSMDQVNRIMEKGPWSFNNRLLIMNVLQKGDSPASIDFRMVNFWVHIISVPYDWFTVAMTSSIASKIGLVKCVDVNGPSLWARVLIDVTKPLRRVLKVENEGVVKRFLLQYECMIYFCFHCGRCTHIERECLAALDIAVEGNKFRDWLRNPGTRRTGTQSLSIGTNQQAGVGNLREQKLGFI